MQAFDIAMTCKKRPTLAVYKIQRPAECQPGGPLCHDVVAEVLLETVSLHKHFWGLLNCIVIQYSTECFSPSMIFNVSRDGFKHQGNQVDKEGKLIRKKMLLEHLYIQKGHIFQAAAARR